MSEDKITNTKDQSSSEASEGEKALGKKPQAEEKKDKEKSEESNKKEAKEKKEKIVEKTKKIELKPGMTVRIHQKIKELNTKGQEKERIQFFEGMIMAKRHGNEPGATVTIRKVSNGVGVEKIFPIHLPAITKIEVLKEAAVRRAKLGYLKRGYKKRLKEKKVNKVEVRN